MTGTAKRPRLLIIGLDGVGLDLVQRFIGQGQLPNLKRILGSGAWGALVSTLPAATYPAWTSFMTGANPGRHGVFDFTAKQGHRVQFIDASWRRLPTLFHAAEAQGLKCGVFGFPTLFPPEPLRGFCISGWDSPVASMADERHFHPASLFSRMRRELGPDFLRFEAIDEFSTQDPAWPEKALHALRAKVAERCEAGVWLLENTDVDLFAIYFGEADTASHHLWSFHDPASPFEGAGEGVGGKDPILEVVMALDQAVGRLCEAAPDATILVASDHGSGGTGRRTLHLNAWLEQAGLLQFRRAGLGLDPTLARHAPPRLREVLGRAGDGLFASFFESQRRFGRIDLARTAALSEELGYAPSIWLNLAGRDPKGRVEPRDRSRVLREIMDSLDELRDPESGEPVVLRAWPREELYEGPFVHEAPDLVLELSLDPHGHSYACRPSMPQGPVLELQPTPLRRGAKGGLLPGSHRRHGIFGLCGAGIGPCGEIAIAIEEAASLALLATDVKPAWWMKVPSAASRLFPNRTLDGLDASPVAPAPSRPASSGRGRLVERLRHLGYVD